MEEQEEKKEEINLDLGKWFLKGGTALFFDTTGALANLIPFAGQILDEFNDLFADGVFLLWFKIDGIQYSKRTVFGGFILKFIPLLNLLPEYTLMIIIMYFQAKAKSELQKSKVGGSVARTIGTQGKIPNNQI